MSLIATIALDRTELTPDSCLTGFEGFVLVWGAETLKVYKEGAV